MAEITALVWINEVKESKYGEIWKVAESHSKKNAAGEYENDGRTYYDVYVDAKDANTYKEKDRVTITGRFRSKENEAKDGTKYRNLLIYANSITPFTSGATAPATATVPASWEEVPAADAPF